MTVRCPWEAAAPAFAFLSPLAVWCTLNCRVRIRPFSTIQHKPSTKPTMHTHLIFVCSWWRCERVGACSCNCGASGHTVASLDGFTSTRIPYLHSCFRRGKCAFWASPWAIRCCFEYSFDLQIGKIKSPYIEISLYTFIFTQFSGILLNNILNNILHLNQIWT